MQIEIVEMEDRKAKFILKNSSPAMANALRRTMIQDIPKMAIDKVEFHLGPIMQDDKEYESDTSLFDEVIAHRLGMIPVPTDYVHFPGQVRVRRRRLPALHHHVQHQQGRARHRLFR